MINNAAEAAIAGFSESLRKQVGEQGIKVSLVEPGKTGADFPNSKPEEQPAQEAEGKMLLSEDIASAIHSCLVQPARSDVMLIHIRPHVQAICDPPLSSSPLGFYGKKAGSYDYLSALLDFSTLLA